jgi:hypothetical protein
MSTTGVPSTASIGPILGEDAADSPGVRRGNGLARGPLRITWTVRVEGVVRS